MLVHDVMKEVKNKLEQECTQGTWERISYQGNDELGQEKMKQ
jgi:hypothetical protein